MDVKTSSTYSGRIFKRLLEQVMEVVSSLYSRIYLSFRWQIECSDLISSNSYLIFCLIFFLYICSCFQLHVYIYLIPGKSSEMFCQDSDETMSYCDTSDPQISDPNDLKLFARYVKYKISSKTPFFKDFNQEHLL